jgi:hypothetical protein
MSANIEFVFPLKGINEMFPNSKQPQLTSGDMLNVRPFDALDNRMRGGQRPGLNKWSSSQIGGSTQPVVAICVVDAVK